MLIAVRIRYRETAVTGPAEGLGEQLLAVSGSSEGILKKLNLDRCVYFKRWMWNAQWTNEGLPA